MSQSQSVGLTVQYARVRGAIARGRSSAPGEVQSRRGLVQEGGRRAPQQRARERHALLLAHRQQPGPVRLRIQPAHPRRQLRQPSLRERRLDSFLTFLGPGGFATPDDVEALESCQTGFTSGGVQWNDISRGMGRGPMANDEEQMREYWRRWQQQMGDAADLGGAR